MVLEPPKSSSSSSSSLKYPTARGSEVDSRKIIATGAGRQHLQAVRVQHILFETEPLARASLHDLQNARIDFGELAKMVSACSFTREEGGNIGWISVTSQNDSESDDHQNEHLAEIIPRAAREQLIQITTKPGDTVMVQSSRGFHVVQIVDVMANVRKMSYIKSRKASQQSQSKVANFLENKNDSTAVTTELTYKLSSMGCQMNLADSERIEGQLQSLGIRPLSADEEDVQRKQPDIVILNTCSIRDHAEQKVYSYLGPHTKRKRQGEDVTIIVAGCVAQQEGELLLRRCPEVDLVMGPQYANRIADLLEDVSNGNQVVATEATHIMEDSTKPRRQSQVAAWVNVIYGCNERCAFCVVPATRGVEQSRPMESIMREVQELIAQGYKEVTLLGQNIDAYGRDMLPKRKFSDLLRMVGGIPGLDRLRFVTSHPRYMSLNVVDAVAETPTVCESFHIPFQSGSNAVLQRMGRGHTREKYIHIVNRIRSRLHDAAITADVIVGFPGESEDDFQDTLSLMEEIVFDSINTAAYSPRPNTPAATWDDQVDEDVKQERLQRINKLNLQHAAQRRARMVGRVVDVLVEERNVKLPTQVMGRTRHGYIVYFEGEIDELQGKLVNVEISESATYHLMGKRVL
jgi:tRNA-2-methylthio-N6-dimethylallyladenosine synthase